MIPETGVSGGEAMFGIAGLGGIIWALYEKWMRYKVEKASAGSEAAVFTANETLFTMITTRMESLEKQVERLQTQLDNEREYTKTLISLMIAANMTPPPYPQ